MPKYTRVDDALHEYLVAHRTPDDPLLDELRRETRRVLQDRAGMQISAEEGTFLALLVGALGAKNVVEVGTFTGYSSLCMAKALPPGGKILCCDVSEDFTAIARRFWQKAGVADRIELRLGPALDTLRAMPKSPPVDFAFIDADKESNDAYYEACLRLVRPGGLIAVDNALRHGAVADPAAKDGETEVIRALNLKVRDDRRVDSCLLTVGDGVLLARKR